MRKYELKDIPENYEPKRNNRFYVEFDKKYNIPVWVVDSIDKPTYNFMDSKWEPIIVVLQDPVYLNIAKSVYKLYKDINDLDVFDDEEFFNFKIIGLSIDGHIVEEWKIEVDFIELINFGSLSVYDSNISTITIKIIPQNCILLDE
jgi:hypothetical protein